jgi:hypothetical protein
MISLQMIHDLLGINKLWIYTMPDIALESIILKNTSRNVNTMHVNRMKTILPSDMFPGEEWRLSWPCYIRNSVACP